MDEPFSGSDYFNRMDFYKVLLGILEPTETLFLSTHLVEEMAPLPGRAILLHQGKLVANTTTSDLEEAGTDLVTFCKGDLPVPGRPGGQGPGPPDPRRGGRPMKSTFLALCLALALVLGGRGRRPTPCGIRRERSPSPPIPGRGPCRRPGAWWPPSRPFAGPGT